VPSKVPNGTYTIVADLDTGPFKIDKEHENRFDINR